MFRTYLFVGYSILCVVADHISIRYLDHLPEFLYILLAKGLKSTKTGIKVRIILIYDLEGLFCQLAFEKLIRRRTTLHNSKVSIDVREEVDSDCSAILDRGIAIKLVDLVITVKVKVETCIVNNV